MGEHTNSSGTDEGGLDSAKEEIDEEPGPGLGPGADDEESEETENADDESEN
jgi:hypothetical protein